MIAPDPTGPATTQGNLQLPFALALLQPRAALDEAPSGRSPRWVRIAAARALPAEQARLSGVTGSAHSGGFNSATMGVTSAGAELLRGAPEIVASFRSMAASMEPSVAARLPLDDGGPAPRDRSAAGLTRSLTGGVLNTVDAPTELTERSL